MMKVLLISEYFPPKIFGGGEISAWLLAKNLAKEEIDVSILTSHFSGLKKFEVKDGVKIHRRLKTGKDPYSFRENVKRAFLFPLTTKKELIKLDKEENFNVIHCMNINSIIGTSKVKEKIKKPIIAHINSLSLFCPTGTLLKGKKICNEKCSLMKFLECFLRYGKISKVKKKRYLRYNPIFILYVYFRFKQRKNSLKKMDFFIAISNFMKNLLRNEGISKERIAVVPNPVELKEFFNLQSKKHKIPKILFLGAYETFKGPQILLEALKDLKDEKFKCDFYGSGSLKERLERMVKNFKVEDKVKINNPVEYSEIPGLYEQHDLIVFPSLWPEPFGRIAIEAMAAGKPIIASKIGGIVDIIENGKNGFLTKPGDYKELRKNLEKLIKNKKLRKKIGKEGRKSVREKYAVNIISKKMNNIYKKINITEI
jgi:glycosyltransferase involved in cell wall biosynthesis